MDALQMLLAARAEPEAAVTEAAVITPIQEPLVQPTQAAVAVAVA
jgi:hypothetical protein